MRPVLINSIWNEYGIKNKSVKEKKYGYTSEILNKIDEIITHKILLQNYQFNDKNHIFKCNTTLLEELF